MKKGSALFIGRFQPFHNGHLHVVRDLSGIYNTVIIGIGSAQYGNTPENPFTAEERERMIKSALDADGISNFRVVPVPDLHRHGEWVAHVVSLVPKFDTVYTNEPMTMKLFKEAGYDAREIPFLNRKDYSGTEVRKRISSGGDWGSLVPAGVARIINDADGVRRIRKINGV